MSTQTYYKEKLGFDPKEAYYEGPPEKYMRTEEKPHGYEENLTKFKGTIWDLFIQSLEGTVVVIPFWLLACGVVAVIFYMVNIRVVCSYRGHRKNCNLKIYLHAGIFSSRIAI